MEKVHASRHVDEGWISVMAVERDSDSVEGWED
jgi:hypothetical protein